MTNLDDQTDALTIIVQPPSSTLRRERRVQGHHRVRFRAENDEWTTRLCLSLSKGGLFVATQAQYEAGTLLYVELYDGEQWLRAQARVQWTRAADSDPWAPQGMGLQVVTHHFADVHAWGALIERERARAEGQIVAASELEPSDAAAWLAPPDEYAPERRAPSRVREAVLLVGMSCASMGLLLVR